MTTRLKQLAALILLSAPQEYAHADYEAMGAGCMPDSLTLKNNAYYTVNGAVTHKSSNVDLITFYCSVSTPISAPTHIGILYSDSNTASTTFVKATYVKVSKSTGAATAIATATSESGAENGFASLTTTTFSDAFSFDLNYYYIEVSLDRASISDTAKFYGVSLW